MTKLKKDIHEQARESAADLAERVAAGEITLADAEREVDECKALVELLLIDIELFPGAPKSEVEKMEQDRVLLSRWPEACRRAGVPRLKVPADILQRIVEFNGRIN